jgi:RHS repeat-associated protein
MSLLLGDSQGSAQVMMPVTLNPTTGAMLPATLADAEDATRSVYKPYGATRGDDGLTTIDHGWLNQVSDEADTGLIYLNARYYDPVLSRFLSPDPLMNPTDPRTLDPYRYADNNPISYQDASGLCNGLSGTELTMCGARYYGSSNVPAATVYDYVRSYPGVPWGMAEEVRRNARRMEQAQALWEIEYSFGLLEARLARERSHYDGIDGFFNTAGDMINDQRSFNAELSVIRDNRPSENGILDELTIQTAEYWAGWSATWIGGGDLYDEGTFCGTQMVCIVNADINLREGNDTITIGRVVISTSPTISEKKQAEEYQHSVDQLTLGGVSYAADYGVQFAVDGYSESILELWAKGQAERWIDSGHDWAVFDLDFQTWLEEGWPNDEAG